MSKLLEFTNKGIYCKAGGFYIDPWQPVEKAVISHGHSDHAHIGMGHYFTQTGNLPIIRYRLGDLPITGFQYGEKFEINNVIISFHPAGHIPGSSQVRVEYQGEVWVFSGDYKTIDDGISKAFEPVTCDTFITECTFGLPIYHWPTQEQVFSDINDWWRTNKEQGKCSVIMGYSLGKAQRIIKHVDHSIGKVFTHGAVENMNEVLRSDDLILPTTRVTPEIPKSEYKGALIVAPPSALASPWLKRFEPYSLGLASGWMRLRGARRRKAVDRGFILSDHADWDELLGAVKASGAHTVYATHGYTSAFARYLKESGYKAYEGHTEYEGELAEITDNLKDTTED